MEPGFGYRFYNAGKRISEHLRFSISESSQGKGGYTPGDQQGTGFWPLDAPEKGWFFVPAEMESGNETVRVNFRNDIQAKFGERGVVLLDPRWDVKKEDPDKEVSQYPVAPTEEAVIERAEKIWNLYTLAVIERHLQDSDQALAAGGRPRKATGFTKFCFKLHGKIDPGDTFAHTENLPKPGGVSGDVAAVLAAMQAQQASTNSILLAIASGQKLDPEMLKALMAPPVHQTFGEVSGKPVTSGIATGKINKPVADQADGWEKSTAAPKGKGERAKEAVGAL